MPKPLISVQFQPQHGDYDDLRRQVVAGEELGIDVVYTWDHFFPLFGDPEDKHFECWTTLASLAEVTERVQLGPLVGCNSYRNPNLLADMARTVDHISGGRVVLGIGSGWFERDYNDYGYEFGTARSRLADLERDLPILKARLAALDPAPQGSMPIMIGGGGEKVTLRLATEYADIWHYFWSPEYLRKNEVLNEWCRKLDRDPGSISRSTGIDSSTTEPTKEMESLYEVTMGIEGPHWDLAPVREWLEWRDALPDD